MKKTDKTHVLQSLTGAFIACLLISNILAAKTFTLGGVVLPTAVIVFPFVYIVNDVLAEVYGFKRARAVILLGFALNAFAVLAYTVAIALPAPAYGADGAEAFALVLGSTWRLLLASFAAYLVGSLVNAAVMERMKKADTGGRFLMLRCVLSTLIGEGLDACIFISIAFIGTMPAGDLLVMIGAQAAFKTLYEVAVYPVTRCVIKKVEALPA